MSKCYGTMEDDIDIDILQAIEDKSGLLHFRFVHCKKQQEWYQHVVVVILEKILCQRINWIQNWSVKKNQRWKETMVNRYGGKACKCGQAEERCACVKEWEGFRAGLRP